MLTLIFTVTGAFIIWVIKGMKTPFDNEMSRRLDNDVKFYRNLFTGMLFFIFLIFIFEWINSLSIFK
jgi:hypothetical protein